jgi:uncharacterized protein (DUF952 family)
MILHVCREEDWESSNASATYAPSNMVRDGFIHACTAGQLNGVLERYYSGVNNLLLLHIDETKLDAELRFEESTGRELFPHIYGVINKEAIVKIERVN